jgi:hypothetical protein
MYKLPFSRKLITPWSLESIHSKMDTSTSVSAGAPASTAYPAANLAIYVPFYLTVPSVFQFAAWHNGTAVSGNIDVGIYGSKGTRIASIGSTAQAGTTTSQSAAFASPVQLGSGLYFMALAMDNTTGTLFAMGFGGLPFYIGAGIFQQASAFPLPATATFALATSDYLPKFGLSTEGSL